MIPAARRGTRLLACASLALGLLAVGAPAASAAAATDTDIPSVSVAPAQAQPDDPNGGQWFVLELEPGESGSTLAKITNPAGIPQRVVLYVRDLAFTDEGTPFVREGEQEDVGSWSDARPTTLTLGPRQTVMSEVKITAPADADPGDHVGVLVAETSNRQEGFDVVRRVATRLYVTLPGAATREMAIEAVTPRADSRWFPGRVTTEVTLANTGRVRLRPTVLVAGEPARGSQVLLSRSVEQYTATRDIPWYGGIVGLQVQATDDSGLSRTLDKKMVVVPWGVLLFALAAVLLAWRLRHWWQHRSTRMDSLQADLRRLERLLAAQALAGTKLPVLADLEPGPADDDEAHDSREGERVADLLVAVKRAQRAGAHDSLARLALELHSLGGPALPVLLDALESVPEERRAAVLAAVGTYDGQAVAGELQARGLSPDLLVGVPVTVTGTPPAVPEQAPAPEPTPRSRPAPAVKVPAAKAPAAKVPAAKAPAAKTPVAKAPAAKAPVAKAPAAKAPAQSAVRRPAAPTRVPAPARVAAPARATGPASGTLTVRVPAPRSDSGA